MSAQELKVIEFVNKIPPSANPYLAILPIVDNLIRPPRDSDWSSHFQKGILGAFIVMFLQSCILIFQRIRLGTFRGVKYNKLGLLIVDVSDISAITYFCYTSLTVADLCLRLALRNGSNHYDTEIILFGYKFLPIVTCAWVFLWLCALQCASILFEKVESSYSNETIIRVKSILRWSLITFFLSAMIITYPSAMWTYAAARRECIQMNQIVDTIRATVVSEAAKYDPRTYSKLALLRLLAPARSLIPHQRSMESYVDIGIKTYLVTVMFPAIAYIPLLAISLSALFRNSVSPARINAALGKSQAQELKARAGKAHRMRRRLVFHAFSLYASVVAHLPVILWQVINNKPGFLKNATWHTVTVLGLHIPFAITGNLVMIILNINSSAIPLGLLKRLRESNDSFQTSSSSFPKNPCFARGISVIQQHQMIEDYELSGNSFSAPSPTEVHVNYNCFDHDEKK